MNILIISKTHVGSDPRPLRQVKYFTRIPANVDTLSLSDTTESRNKFVLTQVKHPKWYVLWRVLLLALRRFDAFYKNTLSWDATLLTHQYDIIVAHDLVTAPLAFEIADRKQIKPSILIDLHEYLPSQRENHIMWKLFYKPYVNYMADKFLKRAAINVTVNETIAIKYAHTFSIPAPKVVRNIPEEKAGLEPTPVYNPKIRMIHHGVAFPSRGTEAMIEMMQYLDEDQYELYFMLVNEANDPYYRKIQKLASAHHNIHFLPPVPFDQIVPFTNQYDIGLFLLPPLTYNYENALPNKLFEFIHARLAVAIGPSPEMKKIVEEYHLLNLFYSVESIKYL